MTRVPGFRTAVRARRWLVRRVNRAHDGGFILLESIVAIAIISIIMAAFTTFFVKAIISTNHERARQAAIQIADSQVETIRALPVTDLAAGDYVDLIPPVPAIPAPPAAVINPWLVPPTLTLPGALTAALSQAVDDPTVNNIVYRINIYLRSCVILTGGSNCTVPTGTLSPGAGISYMRAVVAVNWQDATCPGATCTYLTATLLNQDANPCLNPAITGSQLVVTDSADPTASPTPLNLPLIPPGRKWTVGSNRALQLAVQPAVVGGSFALAAGQLPPGLYLTPSGLISGRLPAALPSPAIGTATFTFTDACSQTATDVLNWSVVLPPTITPPRDQQTVIDTQIPDLSVLTACVNAVNVPCSTCPNTPCTFTWTNGPVGLTISNSGVISGTPTVAGTVGVTVSITDNGGITVTSTVFHWAVMVPIVPPSQCVPPSPLPNGGFETPTVPAGSPNWIDDRTVTNSISWKTTESDHIIELWGNGGNVQGNNGGIPIAAHSGTQWAELNANDVSALYQDSPTLSGQVLQWSVWHRGRGPARTPPGKDVMEVRIGPVGSPVLQTPAQQATPLISDGPDAWVLYTGVYKVPVGQLITRFQFGAVSTASGDKTIGNFIDDLSLSNNAACLTTPVLPQTSTINNLIPPLALIATRGSGNYQWADSATPTLPPGLSISSSGVITGTPTALGTYPVSLTLKDVDTLFEQTLSVTWTVVPEPTITTPGTQTTTVGAVVSFQINALCPNAPCKNYTLIGKPAGLSIDANSGLITGTPTAVGASAAVRVTVADTSGVLATTGTFAWNVVAAPTISTPGTQTSTLGVAITALQINSVCPNTTCTYTSSPLPTGLTITTAGLVSGIPTAPGATAVTVTVTDSAGVRATTGSFTWNVVAAAPTITAPANQVSTVNKAIVALQITANCPNGPCKNYTITSPPVLPAGLSINATTGLITGTPSAVANTTGIRVSATDNAGTATPTVTFAWNVVAAPTISTPGTQTSTLGVAITALQINSVCPNTTCTYTSSPLPTGLTITTAGLISGTPTTDGNTRGIRVTVTDNAGAAAISNGFTWTVTTPLAGRWTFDEASGTSAADTGGAHPATLAGSYGKTGTSVQGANALTTDGTNALATAGPGVVDTSNSFTVSAWVKLNNTSGFQIALSQDGNQVSGFYLGLRGDTGKFAFVRYPGDSTAGTAATASAIDPPVAHQWYQLTGVYDAAASTLTLYVNGIAQQSVPAPTGWNATGQFVVGRGLLPGLATWVNGAIDDVRAYGGALSADAAARLAQAGAWNLDENSGATANDSSLNNLNGTIAGGTTWTTGISGAALLLDGVSGVVTTATSPVIDTSQSFSVSAWANTATIAGNGTVASVDGTHVSGFWLQLNGSKWAFVRSASDSPGASQTSVQSVAAVAANQWYHLVGVYDSVGRTITLYVNGIRQGTPVAYTTGWKATGQFVIGRGESTNKPTDYFNGTVDSVQAFQFPVDQAGVDARVNLTPPAITAPTASAGSAAATVNWTAAANISGSPVTGYVVTPYLSGIAQTPRNYNTTATSQTLTGLTSGGSYSFTVIAVNVKGNSSDSDQSAAVTPS